MGRPRLANHPKIAVMEPEDISQEPPDNEPVFPLETAGFATASKTEAVRIALAEGLEDLDEIHDFVKAKFGHDMPKSLISSYKSRLGGAEKKVAAVAPKATPEPTGKTMNKSEAARAAIVAGYDKPGPAVDYIKETFGLEMLPTHFSAIKSQFLKKQSEAAPAKVEPAKRGPKPKEASPVAVQPPAISKPAINGQHDLLDALTAMKPLIAQFGAAKVKQMVDLLG